MTWRLPLIFVLAIWAAGAAAAGATVESRYYRVHSDLETGLTRELVGELDAMHGEYARRLSGFGVPVAATKLEVHLFRRHRDYAAYVGGPFADTNGAFMPHRNALAARLEGVGREQLRATLRHEAFHQFAHLVIGPDLPVWLNEGLAELFGDGYWVGGQFVMGQVPPRRLRQLRADARAGRLPDVADLLSMGHNAWHDDLGQGTAAEANYTAAWALTHFLVYGGRGEDALRPRLLYLLKLLHTGYDPDDAFRRAFGDNLPGLRAAFHRYLRDLRATPDAVALEHQQVRADMLMNLWDDGLRVASAAELRDRAVTLGYQMTYSVGPLRWKSADDAGVYFRDGRGQDLVPSGLRLVARPGATLPDLIATAGDRLWLRTCFYQLDGNLESYTVVEPAR